MHQEKRIQESAPLRAFFDEQIAHVHHLFSGFSFKSHTETSDDSLRIVESFVDAANGKLRAANHYADRLRPLVCALYQHLLEIAAQIPPPFEVSHQAFAHQAIVNALFVNAAEIDGLLQGDRNLRDYVRTQADASLPSLYALMTAQKSERTVFGVGMQGDLLVREVSQRAVNFSGHKLHRPCSNDVELAKALKRYLFDEIIHLVKQEMAQRVMQETLKPADGSYEARLNSLANPSVYLDVLSAYLQPVENLVKIERFHFKLSKLGIRLEQDEGQCVNEFELHELTWRGGQRNVLMQVVYPVQDVVIG